VRAPLAIVIAVAEPKTLRDAFDRALGHRSGAHLGEALHELRDALRVPCRRQIEAPDRIRILIWERGVGPTSSSGTGTSASAVAAAAHGGAAREMDVEAPGGTQHVEWRDDGVYLTGWAELVFEGDWLL